MIKFFYSRLSMFTCSNTKRLSIIALISVVYSHPVWAFGEHVKSLSVRHVEYVLIAIGMLLLFALVYIVVLNVRLASSAKKQSKYQQKLLRGTNRIDELTAGVVHLDQQQNIVFINKKASNLLGRQQDNLLGEPFIPLVNDLDDMLWDDMLKNGRKSLFECSARISQRLLKCELSITSNDIDNIALVITLDDITEIKTNALQQQHDCEQLTGLVNTATIGQLCIDLTHQTFTMSNTLSMLLAHEQDTNSQDISLLIKKFAIGQKFEWDRAIDLAQTSHKIDIICRFTVNEINDEELPIRLVGVATVVDENNKGVVFNFLALEQYELAQTQCLLTNSQIEYQTLLNTSNQAIYMLDKNNHLSHCNKKFEALFSTSLEHIKGSSVTGLDIFDSDIIQAHQSNIERSCSRPNFQREFVLNTSSSQRLQLQFNVRSFNNSSNQHAGAIGIISDNTEWVDLNDKLKTERKQFADILDLAPVAIATIDADDHVIHANSEMTNRLGLSEKELKRGSFYQLFVDPNASGKAAKKLHQTGRLRAFAAQLKGKNGDIHPSEIHIDIFDKDKQEYLCWIADRSAEKFQQDKFESLLQHSTMPMAILADKGFNYLNPAACEFFNIEDDDELFGFTPYSPSLNTDEAATAQLARIIDRIKLDGQAKSMSWEHQVGEQILPCQVTYVPMFNNQIFDSILCVWVDTRKIQQADQDRLKALNLHQVAERQIVEKQQLLENSQDQLAQNMQTLADTQSKLQVVQENLSDREVEYSDLKQAHLSVTENLQALQREYTSSRELLSEAEDINVNLSSQLSETTQAVDKLQEQRDEIATALHKSEFNYQQAQQALDDNEKTTASLKKEHESQQYKMQEYIDHIQELKRSMQEKDEQINEVGGQITDLQSQLNSSENAASKLRVMLDNQRKASEQAELQRKELENTYQLAQLELTNKVQHVSHLQSEMDKLEVMSKQQKGDMEQQQALLKQELLSKQEQLQDTEQALHSIKETAELDKQNRVQQQKKLELLQDELDHAEQKARRQKNEMQQEIVQKQAQQQKLQQTLKAKQQELQQTENALNETKQQTEAEKTEHKELCLKLQAELAEMESRSSEQLSRLNQSNDQWLAHQQSLQVEVEDKRHQLEHTQDKLNEIQRQAEEEKLVRLKQQKKLEQLQLELQDVESRAVKQRELIEGSDEERRQYQSEIEQQKYQLQASLAQAEQQNIMLKKQLDGNLEELQKAETQVNETVSGEEKLKNELLSAKQSALALQKKLAQQEKQEQDLQDQLTNYQQTLAGREKNINALESKQEQLTKELVTIQQEYANSKLSLDSQEDSHSTLSHQLASLEQELTRNKSQLDSKESALQQAQAQLAVNQAKLAEQEKVLLAAHKEELQHAQADSAADNDEFSFIADYAMPSSPDTWFNLLSFLQKQSNPEPLPIALRSLMADLLSGLAATQAAVDTDDLTQIFPRVRELNQIAKRISSHALNESIGRLEIFCQQRLVDNISIAWPNVRLHLEYTLKVIYANVNN